MTELEGRALDEALVRALGWTLVPGQWRQPLWNRTDETVTVLPEYHASLDALLRDIEPVCRERGMVDWTVGTYIGSGYAARVTCSDFSGNAYAPTAAMALARAFLAVLTRGER